MGSNPTLWNMMYNQTALRYRWTNEEIAIYVYKLQQLTTDQESSIDVLENLIVSYLVIKSYLEYKL